MANITHDSTVSIQSTEDHAGFPLVVNDEVKLGGVILAWCSEIG